MSETKRPIDSPPGATRRRVDADGIVRIDMPSPPAPRGEALLRWGAPIVVALSIGLFFLISRSPGRPGESTGGERPRSASPARAPERQRAGPRGAPGPGKSPRGSAPTGFGAPGGQGSSPPPADDDDVPFDVSAGGADPSSTSPVAAGGAAGAPRGPIGLQPHGTKKIKVGLVVPEGFELPEGYVRHYQTTDKGQMLPAILMFHADHAPVDSMGRKIAVPVDRVVPPELAPEGMPLEWLDVPEDAYSNPHDDPPTDEEKQGAEAEKTREEAGRGDGDGW